MKGSLDSYYSGEVDYRKLVQIWRKLQIKRVQRHEAQKAATAMQLALRLYNLGMTREAKPED